MKKFNKILNILHNLKISVRCTKNYPKNLLIYNALKKNPPNKKKKKFNKSKINLIKRLIKTIFFQINYKNNKNRFVNTKKLFKN